jgi:hypothetical protein
VLLKDRVELRAHLDHAADLETTVVAHLLDPLAALRVQQRAQLGPDTGGMEARVAGDVTDLLRARRDMVAADSARLEILQMDYLQKSRR